MTTGDDKLEIEKLEGSEDWFEWKYNMRLQLQAKKLWDHVSGSAEAPAQGAANNEQERFAHAAVRAHAMVVKSLSKQVMSLVLRCENAQEVWNRLVQEFEVKTVQNTMLLRTQVSQMRLKESGAVKEHLQAMKEVYDKLAMLDDQVPEKDQVVNLLASLPSSYNALRSVLLARGPGITWIEAQQVLMLEEQQRELQSSKRQASCGGESKEKSVQGALKAELKCFKCHQTGHFKRYCPELQDDCGHRGRSPGASRGYSRSYSRGRGRGFRQSHGARIAERFEAYDEYEPDEEPDQDSVFKAEVGITDGPERWIIDSGASRHMTNRKDWLTDYQKFEVKELVLLGDGKSVEALGKGIVSMAMGGGKKGHLENVLYVPKMTCNLFSVVAAADQGWSLEFDQECCRFKNTEGRTVTAGVRVNRLYQLTFTPMNAAHIAAIGTSLKLWHQRLGHVNKESLKQMAGKQLVAGIEVSKNEDLGFCQGCVEGKKSREPFKARGITTTERLQLVHSDVCGPMRNESFGRAKFFVTFIDDYSRCVKVYCIRSKDQVFDKFREFEALVTNEIGQKIKVLRTDGGGEYTSAKFENFLKQKGIRHEMSAPYASQQNGVAERMNRTLVETARSMIYHAGVSKAYWGEAVGTAAYVRNRIVTSSTGVTPIERWSGKKPDVSNLKVFGCIGYAIQPDAERGKWDRKTLCLRFVGYGSTCGIKGYRMFDERRRRLVFRRDVVFDETNFGKSKTVVESTEDNGSQDISVESGPGEEIERDRNAQTEESEAEQEEENEELTPQVRRTSRITAGVPPQRYAYVNHHAYTGQIDEPTSMKEALESENAKEWKEAADAEFKSLLESKTWELVALPKDRKAIRCKWIFRVKYDKDGKIDRFKGRLVAKGFSQTFGVDYQETFSPVVKFSSVRMLLAWAISKGLVIHQMDVTTAFLNGELEEEIYMEQPEGYVEPGNENLVCRLTKSLYGLKQASRRWNVMFVEHVKQCGFVQSIADPCVFVRFRGENVCVLLLYVDDIIVMASSKTELNQVKEQLKKGFKMKDMGELHYFLGVSAKLSDGKLLLDQHQYIAKLLDKFELKDAKMASTPLDPNVKLVKDDGVSKKVDSTKYQSLIGALLYLAIATRPDIAFAVGVLGRFNSCPTEAHMTSAKRVCRYLKGTAELKLVYEGAHNVVGYSDADWASSLDDRHSTSGNVFIASGGAVSWLSKRQQTVALSTANAEYVALSSAVQESMWMRNLLKDVGEDMQRMTINEDNQSAIKMAQNPVLHSRSKHIDIRHHFIREAVAEGQVTVNYCSTEEMLADILTKTLPKEKFEKLRKGLGLKFFVEGKC